MVSSFRFKKFTVYHDKCAMKVGTDGVLLGAWCTVAGKKNSLDIGTGSGLIALMLAQRSEAQIDAIDIDLPACEQATENSQASDFRHRIRVFHTSLGAYTASADKKYDLIVSNPPFFISSLLSPSQQRNLARHNSGLSLESLLGDSLRLLAPEGSIALILPYEQEGILNKEASRYGLSFVRKTYVIPVRGAGRKRILAELSPVLSACLYDELTIEEARHQYTSDYIALTKAFYLKM